MPITLMPLALPGIASPDEFSQSISTSGLQSIPAGWPGSNTITFNGKPISTSGLSGVASSAVDYLLKNLLKDWIGARGITLVLGLMLIAAAIFTHPVVIENVKRAGKTAAEVAAA